MKPVFASKPHATLIQLPPNSTYSFRTARLKRYSKAGELLIAVLQIDETRNAGCKVYTRRYLVQELEQETFRRFRLLKPLGERTSDGDDCHYIAIGYAHYECTCIGFATHGKCTHSTTMRTFLRNGIIPSAYYAQPRERKRRNAACLETA